nr:immunoglobulin heavy chain junction region [Macaca mulatta]MOV48903.1 immunoglobulin heavy chain junction region [Macaca mulatta]MOV48955.1 immunoglobulin heavy chain junction region [Macaca mulatta]MOV48984.1 immunoglobulin heavy chain junction region [Macaca mulatta]MOV49068.1 immunoglobulin heavy chain junction region [Macaca mulatta]
CARDNTIVVIAYW